MSKLMTELNKLKSAQQYLEKHQSGLVEQLSRIDSNKPHFSELYSDMASSRMMLKEKLQNDILDIVIPINKVKDLIRNDLENVDLNSMKKDVTRIQKNIHNTKSFSQTHLEALQKEEDKLFEEVHAFENKMQKWNTPVKRNLQKSASTKRISTWVTGNVPKEVTAFSEYVAANGGHENGWATEDHAMFLKTRMKAKNAEQLAEVIHILLPDITEKEVIEHEKWYEKYLELKENQKAAIQKWKQKKVTPKQCPSVQQKPKITSPVRLEEEMEKKEELQQKLSLWKAEKRAQELNQFVQVQRELCRRREKEKQRKFRQQKLKKEVDKWKQVKAEAEKAEKLQKEIAEQREKESRAAKANKLIREYQRQDLSYMHRKLQMRLGQTKGSDVLKVSHVEAPRDPARLLKPTKQWILRTYGSEGGEDADNKLSLQDIPKLGIPEWRRSIN